MLNLEASIKPTKNDLQCKLVILDIYTKHLLRQKKVIGMQTNEAVEPHKNIIGVFKKKKKLRGRTLSFNFIQCPFIVTNK